MGNMNDHVKSWKKSRSFFRRIRLEWRWAGMMDARKKRILREFHEDWIRENQSFINTTHRAQCKRIDDMANFAGTYNPNCASALPGNGPCGIS